MAHESFHRQPSEAPRLRPFRPASRPRLVTSVRRAAGTLGLLAMLAVLAAPTHSAHAAGKSAKTRKAKARKAKAKARKAKARKARRVRKPLEVPVEVAVGPAALFVTGPVQDDASREGMPHGGIKLSIKALLTRGFIRENIRKVPSKYRAMAQRMDEASIGHILIPNSLILSPKTGSSQTGMYGITWRPLAATVPLINTADIDDPTAPTGFAIKLSAGLILTYAYLHSDVLETRSMHFLRPGLDPTASVEIPLSDSLLFSIGWTSQLYPPQVLGGGFLETEPLERSIWHVGQAWARLHVRFPYLMAL